MIHYLQQQSLKAAAEVAAGGVVQDAQDYVAAESAALQNKKAKDKSMDELTAQGELCRTVAYNLILCTVLHTAKLDTTNVLLVCLKPSGVSQHSCLMLVQRAQAPQPCLQVTSWLTSWLLS